MSAAIRRLVCASARRPRAVLAVWATIGALGFAAAGALLAGVLVPGTVLTRATESSRGVRLADARVPGQVPPTEVVVVRSRGQDIRDPAFRHRVLQLEAAAARTGAVARSTTWYRHHDRSLVSPDGRATLIALQLVVDPREQLDRLVQLVQRADGAAGYGVAMTGHFTAQRDLDELAARDLREAELRFGLPAALLVLLLVFGSVMAAALSLLVAALTLGTSLGVITLLGQAFTFNDFVVNMIVAIGLALAIDYSLFTVARYREERDAGACRERALATVGATTSRAVFVSGLTLVLALVGMLLVPDTLLRSLATGGMVAGAVAVLAALTLVPALVGALGDRVYGLRLPFVHFGRRRASADADGGPAARLARLVTRRPIVSLVASVAVLVALALPAADLRIGFAGVATLPDAAPSKQGALALERHFAAGIADPVVVVVDGDPAAPAVRRGVAALKAALRRDDDFELLGHDGYRHARLSLVSAALRGDDASQTSMAAVRRLREQLVPASFGAHSARVFVTGSTAEHVDYVDVMRSSLPVVIATVLLLALCVLAIAFRSLVVPVKAVLANLASVAAAYGLLVLVFQRGVGAGLLGLETVDSQEAWLPLLLFTVLFGLSMDYHVLLLSRIREAYLRTGDTVTSVTEGVTSSARLITGAALIIVAVFAGFASGQLVMFQQLGFGVGAALLLDATIVRLVLVPASMRLLGRLNWQLSLRRDPARGPAGPTASDSARG